MFGTEEVLEIAKRAEVQSATNMQWGQPRKCSIAAVIESDEEEEQASTSSHSDQSCIVVARRI